MSPQKPIVIVTDMFDAHTDAMLRHLRSLGHNPYRLHTADFAHTAHLEVRLDTSSSSEIVIDSEGGPLALHDARSIWWRRPGAFTFDHLATQAERSYADDELRSAWLGALAELDCYFMSHPTAINRARHKLGQLERARRLGLTIPETLVTSNADAVREFCADDAGTVIFKPLSQGFLEFGKVMSQSDSTPVQVAYTTQLSDELCNSLGDLGGVPGLFQKRIDKDVELRVTVIGDEMFVAEIDSQGHERTQTDWRHYEIELPWSVGSLPDDVADACMELTKSYGLNFGAIDLIRKADGEHVFLEINANGQWLFVEQWVPELRMMDALSACLIRGANA